MSKPIIIRAESIVNQEECQELTKKLDGAIGEGARKVVLDCTECEYLNSRAIGEMMGAHVKLTASGGKLCLVGVSGFVEKCLDSVGALTLLEKYETVDEASKEE